MTKIVDIRDYRIKVLEQKAFGQWQKRFGESYNVKTKLAHISDKTIYFLAQPGENSSIAYYELIMGVLDLGPAIKFNYLPSAEQMKVVDIHLFLADQMRFEMMRRLEWLDNLPCGRYSLTQMILTFKELKTVCRENLPTLAPSHPGYEDYIKLIARDKEVFIRQMLREALERFQERLES
jgi:hypothetical protein